MLNSLICPKDFTKVVNRLSSFFLKKKYLNVHTQNRLSILAACEDPNNLSTFNYAGRVFPLPQTGQMWLEYELLKDPEQEGFFCISTSYRNESNPVEGRHDLVFPMFEFEAKGDMNDLVTLEKELLEYLGFGNNFGEDNYDNLAKLYGVTELEHEHEMRLSEEYNNVFFIKNFPNYTSPFWNMKQSEDGKYANKVDVILHGIETIGSAERSTDKDDMRKQFETISDGMYSNILYSNFTKERVQSELDEFLSYNFMPRYGGGIGITRLIRAMKLSNLL